MRTILLAIVIFSCTFLKSQDTTYYSDFVLTQKEYGNTFNATLGYKMLDYAVTTPREAIKKLRVDSITYVHSATDWIRLHHVFNTCDPFENKEDSTFTFTQKVFNFWNKETVENDIFTLPVGVIYEEASYFKEESYTNGNLTFSQDTSSFGWKINQGVNFEDIIETHDYSAVGLLYDVPIQDQWLRLVLDDDFIFSYYKEVENVIVNYGGNNYLLSRTTPVDLYLNEDVREFGFIVNFSDSTSIRRTFKFEIETSFFDSELEGLRSSPFTGGKHNFIDLGLLWATPNIPGRLRYGIIWGDCNNSGKINKPVIMLHGFRPSVQPVNPSLEKLLKTKFNYKGASQYGSDGLVDLLVKNGYDVIICRLDPGFASITWGGKVMAEFIRQVVEPDKAALGSKHENIVLGFSMGGHYLRYMLMYEDHRHLNNGANHHHHTRMWIPTDTPLHGANNPLAHQFAAKSLALSPAGFPSFNIAYNNMLSIGSQEQQRYDVNGVNGNDGATHRFHQNRVNYIDELENTFDLGSSLNKYAGFPSSTRNVGISVGSNSIDNYSNLSAGQTTFKEESMVLGFFNTKYRDIILRAAVYSPTIGVQVFKREIIKESNWSNNVNVLVDDQFHMSKWYEWDNAYGSYFNTIRNHVNNGLVFNSIFGFTDIQYDDNQTFLPTLSALAIHPSFWPTDMRMNLKDEGLMFNQLGINYNDINLASDHYGYPHLGRPNDYDILTPMDAYYCNELTYEHITLIDDADSQNDQAELIDFLLNEIEPWYLDLQNQDLGAYARPDYTYQAKYQARNIIQAGAEISPKTPFGEYRLLPNTDVDIQAGEAIHLKPGTHIQQGAKAHLYIAPVNYDCNGQNKMAQNIGNNGQKSNSNIKNNLSINESNLATRGNKLSIYPNPNNGSFTVNIEASQVQEGILEIYTLQGQLIDEISVKDGTTLSLKGSFTSKTLLLARLKDKNGLFIDETKIMIQ